MAKQVFFSFHYADVADFRVNVVRKHDLTKEDRDDAGYHDKSLWEEAEKKGDVALKKLINDGLDGSSVTAVLIGTLTYDRRWVRYEIIRSMIRGNRVLGIHINSIQNKDKEIEPLGENPFKYLALKYSVDGWSAALSEWRDGKWIDYVDQDSYKLKNQAKPEKRGQYTVLKDLFPVYDWVANKGYENFATWISG